MSLIQEVLVSIILKQMKYYTEETKISLPLLPVQMQILSTSFEVLLEQLLGDLCASSAFYLQWLVNRFTVTELNRWFLVISWDLIEISLILVWVDPLSMILCRATQSPLSLHVLVVSFSSRVTLAIHFSIFFLCVIRTLSGAHFYFFLVCSQNLIWEKTRL